MTAKTATIAKKDEVKEEKKTPKEPRKKSSTQIDTKTLTGKYFYFFGNGKAEGAAAMRDVLGGKGANLAEMTNAGLPVPPGFTITTDVCRIYYDGSLEVPKAIDKEMLRYVEMLEQATKRKFGDSTNPLLLSVRSGSKFSMPGMMDTILNLGLNDETTEGLATATGDARFAYDNYRRFISMFSHVVLGIDKELFEEVIAKRKQERRIRQDSSLQVADLKEIVKKFKQIIKRKSGDTFPDEALAQLRMARDAVFRSWNNPRAITYRRQYNIPSEIGTAVNIQAMVFGNRGNTSATGVGFTRNPSTGVKEFYGEFLINAQGEDVVAGVRTPHAISKMNEELPQAFKQLKEIAAKLEKHYRDAQDFEFTVEDGKLYMLQTRNAKRTTGAAIHIAVDMVKEKLITRDEALMRIEPHMLDQLLHPTLDPNATYEVIAKGLPASPGAASGKVYFHADDAVKYGSKHPVILVRDETNPDDIDGMLTAVGILTARGGMTSHAAVVTRQMGKCCIVGAEAVRVNSSKRQFQVGKLTIKEGEIITLNGSTGEIILGEVARLEPKLSGEFSEFMSWADEVRTLKVRANADTGRDATQALQFGAEGIGLCRTEHMFFAEERIPIVQKMILADTPEGRQAALQQLLPMQRKDFKEIFNVMHGLPVTIRTLDPPLHEFLPRKHEVQDKLAKLDPKADDFEEEQARLRNIVRRIDELSEMNPMLGHRGCRLGIVFPEITEMQVRAIMEAACDLIKDKKPVTPEIMIPLVGHVNEFIHQKQIIERIAHEVATKTKVKEALKYSVGTMIEIPRAALTADEIAKEAEFFSFGTNDLTQMGMGFSRDDAGKFLTYYVEHGILPKDPFVSIDRDGIGQLIKMGTDKGRAARPSLKVGVCGEHGGDPDSIEFFQGVGLDYVSCSPYRVPIARLAAAQVVLRMGGDEKKGKKGK